MKITNYRDGHMFYMLLNLEKKDHHDKDQNKLRTKVSLRSPAARYTG